MRGFWISWAAPIPPAAVHEARRYLRRHFDRVLGSVASGLTNGPIEGLNGKIRTTTRRAYGFHSAGSLISSSSSCCTGRIHPV